MISYINHYIAFHYMVLIAETNTINN